MLEGLDKINWNRYWGAYSGGKAIPDNIRALISEDSEVRKAAQNDIREEISHQRSIYPATPYVIPFLIEILAANKSAEPYFLLRLLYDIAKNASETIGYYKVIERHYTHSCFLAFQNILKGYNAYRLFLNHASPNARGIAARLLSINGEKHHISRGLLRRQLKQEQNAGVQISILFSLSRALNNFSGIQEQQQEYLQLGYSPIFLKFIKPEYHRLTRLAAAITSSDHAKIDKEVTRQELDIFFDVLINPIPREEINALGFSDNENDFARIDFVLDKISRFIPEDIAPYLNDQRLNPLLVHYLGREVLDKFFSRIVTSVDNVERQTYWKWERFNGWLDKEQSAELNQSYSNIPHDRLIEKILGTDKVINYGYSKHFSPYQKGKMLNTQQKSVIALLVNCEGFWTIKSNLFSFFYGLPDEREALRRLL